MPLSFSSSPFLPSEGSVGRLMLQVLVALVPGVAAYVWFFGWGVVLNILLAGMVAVAVEALMLRLRHRQLRPFLTDGSAVVTGVLLALAIPPLAPWWVTTVGVAFAIVFGKQLFGGLGYNPFNPAMLGYAVLLISFPREMTTWLQPATLIDAPPGLLGSATAIFTGQLPGGGTVDAISSATPLDTLKTELVMNRTVEEVTSGPLFGSVGGTGWEWVTGGYLLGGLWLLYKRAIAWHIPVAMLGSLFLVALVFSIFDSGTYASPLFHLFSGAAMLGAFFIATDPVSASTTNMGRLVYGAGIGILTYVIRAWGGYPDGVAFAVLLMNMATPTIDYYTQPRVFGRRSD